MPPIANLGGACFVGCTAATQTGQNALTNNPHSKILSSRLSPVTHRKVYVGDGHTRTHTAMQTKNNMNAHKSSHTHTRAHARAHTQAPPPHFMASFPPRQGNWVVLKETRPLCWQDPQLHHSSLQHWPQQYCATAFCEYSGAYRIRSNEKPERQRLPLHLPATPQWHSS